MRALFLIWMLPLTLLGQELRVAAVVRQGPPPYAEADRLYRLEGPAAARLRVGQQLELRRPDSPQKPGTLVVVQVLETYALARIAVKGDTYPLKGDLVLGAGMTAPASTTTPAQATPIRPPRTVQPAVRVGQVLFLVGTSTLSPGGKQKLRQWAEQHGKSRVWVLEAAAFGSEEAPLAAARIGVVRAELAALGITQVDTRPGQGSAQGEFPSVDLSLAAVEETPAPEPPPVPTPTPIPAPAPVATPKPTSSSVPAVQPPAPPLTSEQGRWEMGLGALATTFDARYAVTEGAYTTDLDAGRDLRLNRVRTGPGLFVEYQGPRFLWHLAGYGTTNRREFVLTRSVNVDTTTYHPGDVLKTELSFRDYELGWTIKVLRGSRAYVGIDLGVNIWTLKGSVEGPGTLQGDPFQEKLFATTTATGTLPLPQMGLSFGWRVHNTLDLRGYGHALGWKGASYRRYGLEFRYFPLKHLGFRLNGEQESLNAPLGSVSEAMTFNGEKGVVGLGAVVRY